MRRTVVLCLLALVSLAAGAQAAEPFVVLVDEERGLLLIPEGTAVPMGVELRLTREEGAEPQRLVYAYAAPERFVEARRRIAEAEQQMVDASAVSVVEMLESKGAMLQVRPAPMAEKIADFDQTYYYYFWDNSYHAIRKKILNVYDSVQYNAYGYVYSAAGDWDTKVYVSNSCPQTLYPWTHSKTCWYYNQSGTCTPATWIYQTSQPVTATITSQASLTRYLYPPCDLPCKSNSSSTLSVSFP